MASCLKMMPALSFVPEPLVEASFELVLEETCEPQDRQELEESTTIKTEELASSFHKNYIRGETILSVPVFPSSLWNHSESAAEGLARTTDAVEGCQLGVTALFQGIHPPMNVFLQKTQLDTNHA